MLHLLHGCQIDLFEGAGQFLDGHHLCAAIHQLFQHDGIAGLGIFHAEPVAIAAIFERGYPGR
jgi:hypothetical protein